MFFTGEPVSTAASPLLEQLAPLALSIFGKRKKPQMTQAQARALLSSRKFGPQVTRMLQATAASPRVTPRQASSTIVQTVVSRAANAPTNGGSMSLLGNGDFLGTLGSTISNIAGSYFNAKFANASMGAAAIAPMGPVLGGVVRSLPALGGAAVGAAVRGGGALMRGATTWCRRNPAWCAQVGGTAAVAAMIGDGRLPMPKKRRGRGLSARDLRSFRRVNNLLAAVCKTPVPRGPRRKSC